MPYKTIGRILSAALVMIGVLVGATSPAAASAQGCTSAFSGYVCTTVNGSGTWVESVSAIRGKIGDICRSDAWAYYVPPSGGAYGLGWASRSNCAYGRAWFDFAVGRTLARGSLVCTKFSENGTPVGGEPCVRIG